jgi:metal-responsive CopG/Arc/MetJ family transcriptional regulator
MERSQLNVRLDQELVDRIDEKRIELRESLGQIPTRSDILRMALENFLAPESAAHASIKGKKPTA